MSYFNLQVGKIGDFCSEMLCSARHHEFETLDFIVGVGLGLHVEDKVKRSYE